MRLGSLIEHSLTVEGYWFSSADSNEPVNPWMTTGRQAGQSAVVRNNVQLVYRYPSPASAGIILDAYPQVFDDGRVYSQRDNRVFDNIIYRTGINLSGADQLRIASNRFNTNDTRLPDHPVIGTHNSTQPMSRAADSEGWPDPDRTLRRYVTEVLGLELLEWTDDPYLPSSVIPVGQEYDPTGVKTFMAVATNMRYGGVSPAPPPGMSEGPLARTVL